MPPKKNWRKNKTKKERNKKKHKKILRMTAAFPEVKREIQGKTANTTNSFPERVSVSFKIFVIFGNS